MAQAQEEDSALKETRELEQLLEASQPQEGEGEESSQAEQGEPKSRKKLWLIVAGANVLLLLLGAGAYFFFTTEPPKKVEEAISSPKQIEATDKTFHKVNIFALEPFFLPLKIDGRETGSFISVTPNLVLSNSALDKEIEKNLPSMRKEIYETLKRKSPKDYFMPKGQIEEQIKKEILTSVNPLLLAGTGTVSDVVFTQFVVK